MEGLLVAKNINQALCNQIERINTLGQKDLYNDIDNFNVFCQSINILECLILPYMSAEEETEYHEYEDSEGAQSGRRDKVTFLLERYKLLISTSRKLGLLEAKQDGIIG